MYTVLPAPLGPSACTLTVCIVALLYLTNGPKAQAVELAPGGWEVQLLLAATLSPADPRRRLSDPAPGAGTLKARHGLTYPITTAAAPHPAQGARSRLVT